MVSLPTNFQQLPLSTNKPHDKGAYVTRLGLSIQRTCTINDYLCQHILSAFQGLRLEFAQTPTLNHKSSIKPWYWHGRALVELVELCSGP